MTEPPNDLLAFLKTVNTSAAFNSWAGFEVTMAEHGLVELRMQWRAEFGQYSGFLHAGIITALIDTASGFAAATATGGNVTASHCAVNFLAPAQGDVFVARARVVKAGRKQVFVDAQLMAERDDSSAVVATGNTILVPLSAA